MNRLAGAWMILALALAPTARAQDAAAAAAAGKPAPDPAAQAKLGEAVAPSLVRVEYTLQYDKGEEPTSAGWTTRCPSCGQYHGADVSSVVKEDRPLEMAGFLVGPDEVITPDLMIHPRFVKKIAVSFGGGGKAAAAAAAAAAVVDAAPAGYGRRHNAVTLKLAAPLADARPLAFDGAKAGPYAAVTYTQENGDWTVAVQPLGGAVSTTAEGRRFTAAPAPAVVVAPDGTPVALSMNGDLPVDDSWKGAPADWPRLSADELAGVAETVRAAAAKGLLRVTLNFRSPRAQAGQQMFSVGGGDDETATVQHVTGVLLDDRTVLVLSELKSNVTARLEKVRVRQAEGQPVEAKFAHTLTDYGAFVATLDAPLAGAPAAPAGADLREARGALLPAVQVLVQGEKRTEYHGHRRISGFGLGFRRQLYPALGSGDDAGVFLFDEAAALVALPVARRTTVSLQEDYGGEGAVLTPVSYLRAAVAALPKTADPGNVPLSEEEENRLAWLGVELQSLNAELARANDVSHLTGDGATGALVTHVYPNSPASEAGVEPGWILVRAHVEGEPKPLEVSVDEYQFADQAFPWEQYDQFPEEYFDRMPQPWPPAENSLTRALTDLGFGRPFEAEFFHDGKVERKAFKVSQSPAYYGSAPKFKLDALGLTVRDLTYEVRRYFQRADDEPGVIISKIEMGSKASTSGLKPFEMVTHVNDQPVNTVADFEKFTKDQQELRLSIRRMAKGRQVKVKVTGKDPAAAKPTGKAADPAAPDAPADAADAADEADAEADADADDADADAAETDDKPAAPGEPADAGESAATPEGKNGAGAERDDK